MSSQTRQLLNERETDLLESFRACCPEHQDAIEFLTKALAARCAAAHNDGVLPFIRTTA